MKAVTAREGGGGAAGSMSVFLTSELTSHELPEPWRDQPGFWTELGTTRPLGVEARDPMERDHPPALALFQVMSETDPLLLSRGLYSSQGARLSTANRTTG